MNQKQASHKGNNSRKMKAVLQEVCLQAELLLQLRVSEKRPLLQVKAEV